MKTLLYTGSLKIVSKSGVGEAIRHQEKLLKHSGVPYTKDYKSDFDIVHLNTIFPDSLIISKLAKRKNKKVVYYAHSTMEDFKNSFVGSNLAAPLFKRWITRCYNSGDIVITPTPYSKKILENYGIKPPVYDLSNGVDTDFFKPDEEAGNSFRKKYNIGKNQKVIISAGHYIERKGILDFAELAKQLPEYQFYWFGYTNLNLVPKKIRKVLKLDLPNLHFPGYIDRTELKAAYNGSDLFIFLSNEETEGIVVLEALSSKIPVLLRDIPVFSDWLTDGKTVYKAKNIDEFREKIVQILNGSLPDLTENGYKTAKERDLKKIASRLLSIYNQ